MDHEGAVLWRTLGICFAVIGVCELAWPAYRLRKPLERRWGVHVVLFALGNVLVLATVPLSGVAVALAVEHSRFGLFNQSVLPFWMRCAAGILVLDLARYGTHRLMHTTPWLWRIHLLHHTDTEIDLTTGLRFHPLEAWVAGIVGLGVIAATAIPPAGVFLFEMMVQFQAVAAHANSSLPPRLERICRPFFITPDLHRIHHSIKEADQGRNLGVLFPWWDRWFATYRDVTVVESKAMNFGLADFPATKALHLPYLLATPFVKLPSPDGAVPEPVSRRA
ncbi:MAG: sterol desaturase family protein [Candidatus Solibacter usitatus]|nr:sterol desaturase family protein [Candidatus Solibacter usitatus]